MTETQINGRNEVIFFSFSPSRNYETNGLNFERWAIKLTFLRALLGLTADEVTGNAMLFLLAGYDTTASTMTFMAYCLGTNPESQEKLIDEIDSVLGKVRIRFKIPFLDTYM
jgi:hypothetical protein